MGAHRVRGNAPKARGSRRGGTLAPRRSNRLLTGRARVRFPGVPRSAFAVSHGRTPGSYPVKRGIDTLRTHEYIGVRDGRRTGSDPERESSNLSTPSARKGTLLDNLTGRDARARARGRSLRSCTTRGRPRKASRLGPSADWCSVCPLSRGCWVRFPDGPRVAALLPGRERFRIPPGEFDSRRCLRCAYHARGSGSRLLTAETPVRIRIGALR